MITGFHHVAISVPDLASAVEFYCKILGFENVGHEEWGRSALHDQVLGLRESVGRIAWLRRDGMYLEIFQFASPEPRPQRPDWRVSDLGPTHICLSVDNVREEHARLSSAGMSFISEPVDAGGWCVYGLDPFGNVFELFECPADWRPAE